MRVRWDEQDDRRTEKGKGTMFANTSFQDVPSCVVSDRCPSG
jgi:hypothetical protein